MFLSFAFIGFGLSGCEQSEQRKFEEKLTNTLQNALEDSGLKETLQTHLQNINDFLESNKTKDFIEEQKQILTKEANELGKIVESNTTKELLKEQMESLNKVLK